MKKTFIMATAISLLSLSACKKELSPGPAAGSCQLTDILTTGSGDIGSADPYTATTSEKLTYNDQKLLSGYSYQSQSKYSSNKTSTYSAVYNYQYDANGYLLKDTYQSNGKDAAGKTSSSSYTDDYNYANNRLRTKKQAWQSTSDGKTASGSTSTVYEYNTDGKMAKYSYTYTASDGSSGSSFVTYEYSGGKLLKYSYSDGRGGVVTPLIEINSQGLLTKSVNGSVESRYQYDAGGNLFKIEEYRTGKKTDVQVYEHDDKKNCSAMIYPEFKGHPDLDFYMGKNSMYHFTGNVLRNERFYVDAAGVEKPAGGYNYSYTYNSNNLPSTSSYTYKDSNGKTTQKSAASYTYSGCN
jgi:hypothetical protein